MVVGSGAWLGQRTREATANSPCTLNASNTCRAFLSFPKARSDGRRPTHGDAAAKSNCSLVASNTCRAFILFREARFENCRLSPPDAEGFIGLLTDLRIATVFCLTSKMSHDRGWRAVCDRTIWILWFHFEIHEVARGVTAMVVGSGAWLGNAQVNGPH